MYHNNARQQWTEAITRLSMWLEVVCDSIHPDPLSSGLVRIPFCLVREGFLFLLLI